MTGDPSGREAVLRSVGRRIRDLRESHRLTQEQLAEAANLHATYVGGVERGERNISVVNLYKLAVALKVPANELLP